MARTTALTFLAVILTARQGTAGFLYVADAQNGVVKVDAVTGGQTLVASGGYLTGPTGIAMEQDGDLLVTGINQGTLVEVDPHTGQQTLLTSGGYLSTPVSVTVSPSGAIYVADAGPSGGSTGRIIEVNPTTGSQTLISTGGDFEGVRDIAVEQNGTLLVGDRGYQASDAYADGSIIQVNPATGAQTYLTYGNLLRNPDHLTLAQNGDIYVADHDAFDINGHAGAVFKVDPTTGAQTLVSLDGYFTGGPTGIALDQNGNIFVSNGNEIVDVNQSDGSQTLLSSGGLLQNPWAMVYVSTAPEPSSLVLLGVGAIGLLGYGWRRRNSDGCSSTSRQQRRTRRGRVPTGRARAVKNSGGGSFSRP